MAGSQLGHLAGAPRDDGLVAFPTTLAVMSRSEAILDDFELFVDESIVIMRALRHHVVRVQLVERGPCSVNPFVLSSNPVGASDATV